MRNPLHDEQYPVVSGLVALVAVAAVVGLILGLGALAGARVAGLDEEADGSGAPGGELSMYLPRPQRTSADTDPEITLAPGPSGSSDAGEQGTGSGSQDKKDKKDKDKEKAKPISLSASQTSVAPMQQIDLTGTYPGGEGAILQVQRFESGKWADFPVTVTVSNQTFSTYVQTGRTGMQRFRVVDSGSGKPSNEVRVTVQG